MSIARILGSILGLICLSAGASLAAQTEKASNSAQSSTATQAAPQAPAATAPEAELSAADIYKKDLPSIVYIGVQTKDGKAGNGSGYVGLKDGYVVTCWHVVHDAKSVTVRFSDGEEYETTGLVDHDVKNDLALIKVRVAGRPLLPMGTDDPAIGANAYVIGAPLGLDFTISNGIVSQIRKGEEGNFYQFTAAASPGNSGGPVVDATGQVIGLVDKQITEGQNLNFAVPAKYAMALDPTLPTKPWSDVVDDTPADKQDADTDRQGDTAVWTAYIDTRDALVYLHYVIHFIQSYRHGVPSRLYGFQELLKKDADTLSSMTSDNPARETLLSDFVARAEHVSDAIEYESRSFLAAQNDNGWSPEADDLNNHSLGIEEAVADISAEDRRELLSMNDFISSNPVAAAELQDTSPFRLGIGFLTTEPLAVLFIEKGMLADHLGLKAGDSLVTVDGQKVTDVLSARDLITKDADQTVDIVVQRGDKQVEIKKQVPAAKPQ